MDEITEMLFDDSREKHKIGKSHASRGRRGSAKTMRTAIDLLSGNERRKYRGTGRVRRYVMYDTIIKLDKLLELPREEMIERLTYWRHHYRNKEVSEGLGVEDWKVYELYKKHKIPAKMQRQPKEADATKVVEVFTPVPMFPSGTRITIDKQFSGESLVTRLQQIIGFIEEDGEYNLKLIIEETA
ncbi:hypothetical protein [Paenibacillus sp. NPDC057967]|uniref:hypothetical protein n=1 Tax=Paenibacillus sp. NPDC057967 TaxID=3346293 RepID=UPI0036D890C2